MADLLSPDTDHETPGVVACDDTDNRQVLTNRGFELGDVKHERGIASDQHDGFLALRRDGRADGVRKPCAEVTRVLVPYQFAWDVLRIGPPEDGDGTAVDREHGIDG